MVNKKLRRKVNRIMRKFNQLQKNEKITTTFKVMAVIALLFFTVRVYPTPQVAKADAADPISGTTIGNYVINGDGTITLTVSGQWHWTTHLSDCNTNRFGVGWDMDWNDASQAGNVLTTSPAVEVGTLTGNSLNPADNAVHYASSSPYCGTFNPTDGFNSGNWGPLTHTYPAGTTSFSPCVVTYDIHEKNGGPKAGDLLAGGAHHNGDNSVEANQGEHKGCFTATVQTLIVQKHVVNDNGGSAVASNFTMNVSGNSPDQASFAGSESGTNVHLGTGGYSVDEGSLPGYAKTLGAACSGNIAPGETKICKITNDDVQSKITVNKVVINNSGTGTASASDFTLKVGATVVSNGVQTGINAGSYTVSETGASGYTASFSGDCDPNGNITLAIADEKTCTITNNDNPPPPPTQGSLTVIKVMNNDNGGEAAVSDFTLRVDQTEVTSGQSNDFDPGDYVVSETGGPSGYSGSFSGDCDENGALTIVAGESYECALTNDDMPGTLIVKKLIDGGDAQASDFSFKVNGGDTVQFESDGQNDLTVDAGTYTVVEQSSGNYNASYDNCTEITIENGGVATCTITNTFVPEHVPQADLTVEKSVDNSTPHNGDQISYSVTVKNDGPDDATGVSISDLLPLGLSYVSDDGNGAYDSGTGIWTIGSLANGASVILTVTAEVTGNVSDEILNHAVATAIEIDPNSDNNQDDALVTVAGSAERCVENCETTPPPPPSGGGGGGGSSGGGSVTINFAPPANPTPSPSPTPTVAGAQETAAPQPPAPQVQGETLPRTGVDPSALAFLSLLIGFRLLTPKSPKVKTRKKAK